MSKIKVMKKLLELNYSPKEMPVVFMELSTIAKQISEIKGVSTCEGSIAKYLSEIFDFLTSARSYRTMFAERFKIIKEASHFSKVFTLDLLRLLSLSSNSLKKSYKEMLEVCNKDQAVIEKKLQEVLREIGRKYIQKEIQRLSSKLRGTQYSPDQNEQLSKVSSEEKRRVHAVILALSYELIENKATVRDGENCKKMLAIMIGKEMYESMKERRKSRYVEFNQDGDLSIVRNEVENLLKSMCENHSRFNDVYSEFAYELKTRYKQFIQSNLTEKDLGELVGRDVYRLIKSGYEELQEYLESKKKEMEKKEITQGTDVQMNTNELKELITTVHEEVQKSIEEKKGDNTFTQSEVTALVKFENKINSSTQFSEETTTVDSKIEENVVNKVVNDVSNNQTVENKTNSFFSGGPKEVVKKVWNFIKLAFTKPMENKGKVMSIAAIVVVVFIVLKVLSKRFPIIGKIFSPFKKLLSLPFRAIKAIIRKMSSMFGRSGGPEALYEQYVKDVLFRNRYDMITESINMYASFYIYTY